MDAIDHLLAEIHALDSALPPVETWHPDVTHKIDIRINHNGEWFHEGRKITRQAIARLFSTILRKDPDGYCLVTPSERYMITVDDAPFLAHLDAVLGEGIEQEIFLRTNMEFLFRMDSEHPLSIRSYCYSQAPYVRVRGELDARIERSAYYQLTDYFLEQDGVYGLVSARCFFPVE